MKSFTFIIVLFCLGNTLNAQSLQWAKQWGGGGSYGDQGMSIAIDAAGNIYTTGGFSSTVDFDPGPGTYNLTASGWGTDIFVTKSDASGNLIWAKRMGGSEADLAYSIAVDATGNVYTTGYFMATADFDPGGGTFNMSTTGGFVWDIFISKLDPSGNFLWAKEMGSSNWDIGFHITLDAAGNVYTTGTFNGTVDFDTGPGTFNMTSVGAGDVYLSKLDAAGNFLWAKQWGGSSWDVGIDIDFDAPGNVYCTGSFNGTVDFDPGAGIFNLASASGPGFINKLDASGNFIWAKQIGGGVSCSFIDGAGTMYIGGALFGTADFDPGPGTYNLTSNGGWDIFISKLDASGNFVWAKSMGGGGNETLGSIAVDAAGYVYTTGEFYSSADFDPGVGTFLLTSAGFGDIFISQVDASGNFVCGLQMGGVGGDRGYGIALDTAKNIYITGYFSNTADFDPGAGTYNMTSAGGGDAFLGKYKNCYIPLPIELISFTGMNIDRYNFLEWQTASETNNDYFTVERANPQGFENLTGLSEGEMEWEDIGTVEGAGNSNTILHYEFTDHSPPFGRGKGWVFYRLKQTDFDGKYEYSNIITVEMKHHKNQLVSGIYPNPANERFNFTFLPMSDNNQQLELAVYNATGQLVQTRNYGIISAASNLTFETAHLPGGLYNIVFTSGQQQLAHRVIVQHN